MKPQFPQDVVRDGELWRCGLATLETYKRIHLVHLKGSYAEMGWQHGKLASGICGDLVVDYLDHLLEILIRPSIHILAKPLTRILQYGFYALNRKQIGHSLLEQSSHLASALGLPKGMYERVIFVPDILHFLLGKAFPSQLKVSPGCSGFVACRSATAHGRLLIGRNFDFFGQDVWDAVNAIIVMEPPDGHKVCWIGALGLPASAQGFNEAGLFISMHTNFNRDVYLLGTPIFAIVTAILERCITLDQAIALLVSTPRICGLSLVIVDSKNREAAAVGFTANHHEILRLDNDILVRTNHYLTDDMKRHEVAPHAWMMHSQARFTRLHELLAEKRGTLLAEDIPRMLADDLDPWERRRRVVGTIVNATNNAQSVVLSPEEDAMWLANGKFPTCSSDCFVGFRISALFDRDRSNYAIGDLRGSDVLSAREREAQRHYQLAWIAHNDNRRDDLATFHLRCAGNLLPDEPIFPRLAGLILLKHQKLEQALPLLRKNAQYEYKSEIMYAESQVWLARCLDLMGRRDEALCHYRRAAMLDTPPVCHAASRHLLHPFKLKHLSQIMPEFIVGTALSKW